MKVICNHIEICMKITIQLKDLEEEGVCPHDREHDSCDCKSDSFDGECEFLRKNLKTDYIVKCDNTYFRRKKLENLKSNEVFM